MWQAQVECLKLTWQAVCVVVRRLNQPQSSVCVMEKASKNKAFDRSEFWSANGEERQRRERGGHKGTLACLCHRWISWVTGTSEFVCCLMTCRSFGDASDSLWVLRFKSVSPLKRNSIFIRDARFSCTLDQVHHPIQTRIPIPIHTHTHSLSHTHTSGPDFVSTGTFGTVCAALPLCFGPVFTWLNAVLDTGWFIASTSVIHPVTWGATCHSPSSQFSINCAHHLLLALSLSLSLSLQFLSHLHQVT